MTRGLENFLNLPSLEDAVHADGALPAAEPGSRALAIDAVEPAAAGARDHAAAMDEIHREALKTTRDLVDLGFNMDPIRAARIFEMAALMMKNALDAKNSKRNAELKTARLVLDQRKLALDERRHAGVPETPSTDGAGAVLIEDRNLLIRQIRAQLRADPVVVASVAPDRSGTLPEPGA